MNKGIYRIAAGVGAAVILVSSATAQAATVTADGTPAPVASDSIAGWPAAPAVTSETAVLINADTGAVLYDKGMDEYRYREKRRAARADRQHDKDHDAVGCDRE